MWEALAMGHPALVQTDLFYLPYYGSYTHFPGHLIVVWGYDAARQVCRMTDAEHPQVLDLSREALAAARFSREGPFPLSGQCYAPGSMTTPEDLPARLHAAILADSVSLLSGRASFQSVARWQADLSCWPGLADWQWTARYIYQIYREAGHWRRGVSLAVRRFSGRGSVLTAGDPRSPVGIPHARCGKPLDRSGQCPQECLPPPPA